jgi:TetR/AcrR family transcriptional regulator
VSKQQSVTTGPDSTLHQTGRMAADERRRQILNVAVDLFSKKGFRGTTTKEIAQGAGVSEAIIFRHFANKEELYSAIIDTCACVNQERHHLDSVVREACDRRDDRAVFETVARAILDFHEENPAFQRLLLHSALEGHELSQMFWDTTVVHTYEVLGGYIRQRQEEGAFREVNPKVVVRAFIGMLVHHSLNNNLWDKARKLLAISNEDAARAYTEILLKGIGANGADDSAGEPGQLANNQGSSRA